MRFLTIELGQNIGQIVECTKQGKNVTINRVHHFESDDDLTKDGKVRMTDPIVSAIKRALIESKATAKDVFFIANSSKVVFKNTTIPFVKEKDILPMLTIDFENLFAVDKTLYHIDYKIVKSFVESGKKMLDVDVFAIPNDLTESYYLLSVALGLNLKGVGDSNYIAPILSDLLKGRNVVSASIGENTTNISIYESNELKYSKTIPYGISSAIEEVKKSDLTLQATSYLDSAELLYTQNIINSSFESELSETDDDVFKNSTTNALLNMTKQIETTVAQVIEKEQLQIQEFVLSGLGAGVSGISPLLSRSFGVPVSVVQSSKFIKASTAIANDSLYLSIYPLAAAGFEYLNFITDIEKAGGQSRKNQLRDRYIAIGCVALSLLLLSIGGVKLLKAKMANDDANEVNVELNNKITEYQSLGVEEDYNEYMNSLNYNTEVFNLYNETKTGNEDMTEFLDELGSIIPYGAVITQISMSTDKATIVVQAQTREIAAGTIHLLRNMETINSFTCNSVGEDEEAGLFMFSANFGLKNTEEKHPETSEEDISSGEVVDIMEEQTETSSEESSEPIEESTEISTEEQTSTEEENEGGQE